VGKRAAGAPAALSAVPARTGEIFDQNRRPWAGHRSLPT
jgi:hypothetical protein